MGEEVERVISATDYVLLGRANGSMRRTKAKVALELVKKSSTVDMQINEILHTILLDDGLIILC